MPRNPQNSTTTSGKPPQMPHDAPAPGPIDPSTGMHTDYWVLKPEERAKGFTRPMRRTYRHVGVRPKYPLRELSEEEKERHAKFGPACAYTHYEEYPESERPKTGRYWTQAQLDSGCGQETTMSLPIAETYAREPGYYGSTFCCTCGTHFPVKEFVWVEPDGKTGPVLGS